MAEKQSRQGKEETMAVRKSHIHTSGQAAHEQTPPFPIPPHLAHADLLTLYHMQRTLGRQTVQHYLLMRQRHDAVQPSQGEQEVTIFLRRE